MKVDLILIGARDLSSQPDWSFGKVLLFSDSLKDFTLIINEHIKKTEAEFLVFWNASLGLPEENKIQKVINLPGDVWHYGLKFGRRRFRLMEDFINPVQMFNLDPDDNIESSSYKLTLDACVIKKDVISQLGFINPNFSSLEAASLELGYRYLFYGAFVRYIPWLAEGAKSKPFDLSLSDELLFMHMHFKHTMTKWALLRSIICRFISVPGAFRIYRGVMNVKKENYLPFKRKTDGFVLDSSFWRGKISVIIPTLKRYPYLRSLLGQLDKQTLISKEVIIADQTPVEIREDIKGAFNFNLKILHSDFSGQCSSRNAAIAEASGEYILFLDDDIEVKEDLLEKHAITLSLFRADVSSGVCLEPEFESLPYNFTYLRISDVFPAGNTLMRKSILKDSGLFDLTFDKGIRADHDLGVRVYLSGAFMVLNPDLKIKHFRACRGGLREYGERKITYHSSVRSILQYHIPARTELYLWLKYFERDKVRNAIYLSMIGLFHFRGMFVLKVIKWVLIMIQLPYILFMLRLNYKWAFRILKAKVATGAVL